MTIGKATSTTTVSPTGSPFTYDGTSHSGGTGAVSGDGIVTGSATLTYAGDQIDAGTYTVTAHYAGDDNHFGSDSAAATMTVSKADATIGVTPYHVPYDGNTHTATGSVTGVGGAPLSGLNLG